MSKKHKITLIVISSLFLLIIVGGIFLSKRSSKDTNDKVMVKNVPNLAKREELLNAMTHKEVIHYKIINSIDFFATAVGEFEKIDVSANSKTKVNYTIDVENRKGLIQIEGNENLEALIKGGQKLEIDNVAKTYKEYPLNIEPKDENVKLLAPKDRYSKDDGYTIHLNENSPKEDFITRKDAEFLANAAESLFNQDYMISYLKDYDKWEIEGTDVFLERDCLKISGKFGYVSRYGASKFIALIDKNTGIILKFQTLTDNNILIDSLETKSIKLDTVIDEKVFEKDLKDYKKE